MGWIFRSNMEFLLLIGKSCLNL